MHIPQQVLNEMQSMAVEFIQEYCDRISIGSVVEEGEDITETIMPQLIVMMVESFTMLAMYLRTSHPDKLNDAEVMKLITNIIADVAIPKARKTMEAIAEMENAPSKADPVDVVASIIEKMKNDNN